METNYYTSKNKYINIQYRVSLETPILSSFQLCKNAIKIQNDIKQLNGHLNYNNHKIIEKELNDFYFNSLLFLSQLNNNDLKKHSVLNIDFGNVLLSQLRLYNDNDLIWSFMNVKRYEESYFKNIDLFTENNTEETYLKNLIKFNEKYIKKGLIFETIDFKIKLTLFKNTTLYLPFLELKENQLSFLKNRLEQIKINEKTGTAIKTKFDFFQEKLQEAGFYNLEKVKGLEPKSQNKLIELVLDNASYGIAMFDFLGFCEFLDLENGVKKKTNTFLSRLYNQNAKDDTKARHLRNSLKTKKPRYTSYLHKEQVKKDYQELK